MASSSARSAGFLLGGGALLGGVFAAYSTSDYTAHLDRQMHAVHCSFVPGASPDSTEANPCKVALFSAFSALFRRSFWGGIPISLVALGAFVFFVGLGLFLVLGPGTAPKRALQLAGVLGLVPLGASLVMFLISLTQLHTFCKLCVGIYVSSVLVAAGSIVALRTLAVERRERAVREPGPSWVLLGGLVAFGFASLLPAVVYGATLPDYRPYLTSCGTLPHPTDPRNSLLKIATVSPKRRVVLLEDPLCPTCKAFHERLVADGVFEKLDVTLALFPLDSECNWNLDRSLHPGACGLSKAVLCGKGRERGVLEWIYEHQEELRPLKQDAKERVVHEFGPDMRTCIDDKATTLRLNQHLQYAVLNHVPVSTPQMFLQREGDNYMRVCDEDTDLGLPYALSQLAPEVLP